MTRTFHPTLAIGVLCLVLYAMAFQGSRGLWEPDEGRYTAVAMEMLRHSDFLHPALHIEHPHYTKPPVTYWAIAAGVTTFGLNEWAARLPNALAFIFTVLLLYVAGRIYLPRRPWLAPLLYATMFIPYMAANIITTDTLLTLWVALAGIAYLAVIHQQRPRLAVHLMWLGFALGFLTKGPPALLLLLAITVFHIQSYGWRSVKQIFPFTGLLLFTVVGLSWYLLLLKSKPQLLDYFIQYELIARVASDVHKRNSQWYGGFLVYGPTLLLGTLPWGGVMLARVKTLWRERCWPTGSSRFLLYWFLLPLVIFFLARSRLPLYLLPLFVPLALLMAKFLESWVVSRRTLFITLVIIAVILLPGARWYASTYDNNKNTGLFYAELKDKLTQPYSEIVFIDESPKYALSLYMDVSVEDVCLNKECLKMPGVYQQEHLSQEIHNNEHNQLYMADAGRYQALKDFAAANNLRVQDITNVRDIQVFTMQPGNRHNIR
jgi:4-amino-4-deoxy-L-arabinose transferase